MQVQPFDRTLHAPALDHSGWVGLGEAKCSKSKSEKSAWTLPWNWRGVYYRMIWSLCFANQNSAEACVRIRAVYLRSTSS